MAKFTGDLRAPRATTWWRFTSVELDGGVMIQFAEPPVDEIQMQHYAFLGRRRAVRRDPGAGAGAGDPVQGRPALQRPQEINTNHGGRGFYFFDPRATGSRS